MLKRIGYEPIPKDDAYRICEEIWLSVRGKYWTPWGAMCSNCMNASKGNPDKRLLASRSDFRGCIQVSKRYDRERQRG